MAGDWIKIESVTPDKPEVFAMADYLKIDPDAVVGKLLRIWIWCDQHTEDGNAASVTKSLLGRLAGEPHFGDAMESVGWLKDTGSGIEIPNFDRHNGQTAKRRALTAKRKAKHSSKSNAHGNAVGNAEVTQGALPREEKRREELDTPIGVSNKKGNKSQNRFKRPTLEDVRSYCEERGNDVDPQAFFDYYEAAGWRDQSDKPVKNWKQKMIAVWEPQSRNGKQVSFDQDEEFRKFLERGENA